MCVRDSVCEETFNIYMRDPYANQLIPVEPNEAVAANDAPLFDCRRDVVRESRETKGSNFQLTQLPDEGCCGAGGSC